VRVTFPKVTVEKATDVNGVIVTVQVDEGQVYKLVAVKAPEAAELVKIAGLKTGEVFDFNRVSAARQKIVETWHRRGYMHATTSVDRQIDDKDRTVVLLLHVDSGPRYTFRTLTIKGLDIISEPAIRKMWGMEEGHPYNPEYPDRFLKVVREESVLENLGETKADATVDEAAHAVDVTLVFSGSLSEKGKKRREGDREKPPTTDNPTPDDRPFPE
jgi:outer membrane protein insertion porin family